MRPPGFIYWFIYSISTILTGLPVRNAIHFSDHLKAPTQANFRIRFQDLFYSCTNQLFAFLVDIVRFYMVLYDFL